MAPNSLRVTHMETRRCNITWTVNQSSHYVTRYLQFEARTRSPGHSWEVTTGPRPTALIPPPCAAIAPLSKGTVAPLLLVSASPSLHTTPDTQGSSWWQIPSLYQAQLT